MKYDNPIDTLVLKGKVRLNNLGGSLLTRTTNKNETDSSKWSFTNPIKHTYHRSNEILVPELIKTQTYDGRITLHTHKHFTTEYGYSIYMGLPSRVYYSMTLPSNQITDRQINSINNTPLFLEIKKSVELSDLKNKLDVLKSTYINHIWKSELELLNNKWIEHQDNILTDYLNDKNNVTTTKSTKKKKK